MITTAKEARQLTKKHILDCKVVGNSYSQCMKDINWSANHGYYETVFNGYLSYEDIKLLKEQGFNVSKYTITCYEDVYYKISWKDSKGLWQRIKEWFC